MKAKIADMEAKAAQKEATNLVNDYINEGKILPKDVEEHVALALSEPEGYQKLMAKAPIIVEINKKYSDAEAKGTEDEVSNEENPVKDLIKRYDNKE